MDEYGLKTEGGEGQPKEKKRKQMDQKGLNKGPGRANLRKKRKQLDKKGLK